MRMNYQKTILCILFLLAIGSCKKDEKVAEAQYPAYLEIKKEGVDISITGMGRYATQNKELVIQTAEVFSQFQQRETNHYVLDVSEKSTRPISEKIRFYNSSGLDKHLGSLKFEESKSTMAGFAANYTSSNLLNIYLFRLTGNSGISFLRTTNQSLTNIEPIKFVDVNDGYLLVGAKINGSDRNVVVIKYSLSFNKIWEKEYGGAGNDMAMDAVDLCDTNYGILAYTYSKGAGDRDIWFLKLDRNGYVLSDTTFGGAGYDEPQRIIQQNGCDLYIAGHSASFGAPEHDGYIIKLDYKGNKVWEKTFGTPMHDGFNAITNIPNTKTFIAAGRSMQGIGQPEDIFLVSFDEDGRELWRKKYGDPNLTELPQEIIADNEFYYLACNRIDIAGKSHGLFIKDKLGK